MKRQERVVDMNAIERRDFLFGAAALTTTLTITFAYGEEPVLKPDVGQIPDYNKWQLSEAEWKDRLTAEEFYVLRREGTERAGTSALDKESRAGIYVCAGCGLDLFSSEQKFDSGTGWPSFFDALPNAIETRRDFKLIFPRTEYHCARCGGHQGHVFNDGPEPTGLRYCNNGVALSFKAESA